MLPAEFQRAMTSVGVMTPGNSEEFIFVRRLGNRLAQARRHAELRARVYGLFHLIRRQQRARADNGMWQRFADARDGIRRARRAKSDFDGIQSTGEQGFSERHSIIRMVNDSNAK